MMTKMIGMFSLTVLLITINPGIAFSTPQNEYDPFQLLQKYYSEFKSVESVQRNIGNYYYDFLIQFHDKEDISNKEATNLDISDFINGSVKSYSITVLNSNRFYQAYKYFDFVSTDLNYEIIREDGTTADFTTNITALIVKRSKIIAIGSNLNVGKVQDIMIEMNFENNYLYYIQNRWRATECIEDSCQNDDHHLWGTFTISGKEFEMYYGSPCMIYGFIKEIEGEPLKFNIYFEGAGGSNSFKRISEEEMEYVIYEKPIGVIEILGNNYIELTWHGVTQESDRKTYGNSYYSAYNDKWLFRLDDEGMWGIRPSKFGTNRIILKREFDDE